MLSSFAKKLRTEWRRMELPSENETFMVAVSGGADSCALLFALHELKTAKNLKLNFIVAHFNHNLRGAESDADESFVRETAEKLEFQFISEKSPIANPKTEIPQNLEQWARNARYEFLEKAAVQATAYGILTAHTANDQAETFLLNLLRGSGGDGLGAMREIREARIPDSRFQIPKPEAGSPKPKVQSPKSKAGRLDSRFRIPDSRFQSRESKVQSSDYEVQRRKSAILLIRPFLSSFARSETENYCREQGIEFCRDVMNEDLQFSRVRIRRELLPLLQTFNPQIVEKLVNTASLLQAENDELNDIAAAKLESQGIEKHNYLELKFLESVSSVMRKRVLRLWLKDCRGDLRRLDSKHLQAIEHLIQESDGGKYIELPGNEIIRKKKKIICFEKK